jgi:hypothetical protein
MPRNLHKALLLMRDQFKNVAPPYADLYHQIVVGLSEDEAKELQPNTILRRRRGQTDCGWFRGNLQARTRFDTLATAAYQGLERFRF